MLCAIAFGFALAFPSSQPGQVRYGIVFDAGSSGSRIHVYTWKVGGGGAKDQVNKRTQSQRPHAAAP